MDDRHLKIFLTVCATGNMTHAAKQLFMTQPSVSQAVAELEKEYGARLFERLNHHLYLTTAGERLRTYASHILNLSAQAKKELSGLGSAGSIRIGASLTVGTYLLPGLICAYRQEMPDVEVFTQVDNTGVIEKLILQDQLDLGIVEGPVYSAHIAEQTVCDDELIIVCGAGHSFWDRPYIRLEDLSGQAFIIREPGSGTRDVFERTMAEAEANWKIAGVFNNTEAIKQSVRYNLGLAVVPKIAVEEEMARGWVREVKIDGLSLKRKFNLIFHSQKFFTHPLQTFFNGCVQQFKATES
jgi:DNA-binding transcriptional LysR family regulator